MFYVFCRFILSLIFKIGLRLEVQGEENIPADGPVVVAPNHISLLDPPVTGVAASRQIYFMAKEELFQYPVFNQTIRALGAFPVRRGKVDLQAIKYSLKLLKSGKVVSVFPEGHISKTGERQKPRSGAFMIAASTGAAIVPALIQGTDLKRHSGWPKARITFGKPLTYEKDLPATKENLALIEAKWSRAMEELSNASTRS